MALFENKALVFFDVYVHFDLNILLGGRFAGLSLSSFQGLIMSPWCISSLSCFYCR